MHETDVRRSMRSGLERRCIKLLLPVLGAYLPGLLLCIALLRTALHLLPPQMGPVATLAVLLMLWGWMQLCGKLLERDTKPHVARAADATTARRF